MNVLEVRNLTVTFGGIAVLSDLSLAVAKGERLVLFGPNGAGKTTLFNAISGAITPAGGSISVFGCDVASMSISRRVGLGLGRTFQITTLFPDLTVLESTMLALQAGARSRFGMFKPLLAYESCRDEAMEMLNQWGVGGRAASLTKQLSYGEQRQVELVLALARHPKLLLLDEPAAGLSIAETEIVERMISKMQRDVTILLIEHDIDLAMRLADRVTVLQNGRHVKSGSPTEIHSDPEIAKIYFGDQHG
ncbi:ABC transporter ATP-binding protein [Bradyrhizobium sp. TM239]|uniref:ABC transporter ATP-binding protein n=1 Tax=Bradyrhizobium sp. TM239 TaxID=2599802 RepID=UPI0027D4A423|nr:ABC transporter ATP-binding protein [Bradyrhizobium sp. TM239]